MGYEKFAAAQPVRLPRTAQYAKGSSDLPACRFARSEFEAAYSVTTGPLTGSM